MRNKELMMEAVAGTVVAFVQLSTVEMFNNFLYFFVVIFFALLLLKRRLFF